MRTVATPVRTALQIMKDQGVLSLLKKSLIYLVEQSHRQLRKYRKIVYQSKQQQAWPDESPLVSVIVPCFNYGAYLSEAIRSVLSQTFQRLEILVIDDGSTDELTKQVLRDLAFEKTTVVHQANQGLAKTRNNGAALARGKYICFLDADDLIEPTYLEKTLRLLESDESVGSCYSWVQCFGDATTIWKTEDLDPFFLKKRNTSSSHSVIRKEAWEKVRAVNGAGYLSKYDGYFEDWVFYIDLVQSGYRGVVIEEPLIRYRIHKNSLGARHKPGFSKMLQTLHDEKKEFFQDQSYRKRLQDQLRQRIIVENSGINFASHYANQQQHPATPVGR